MKTEGVKRLRQAFLARRARVLLPGCDDKSRRPDLTLQTTSAWAARLQPCRYHRSLSGVPPSASTMRARVGAVVSLGNWSSAKKPCATISRSDTGGAV